MNRKRTKAVHLFIKIQTLCYIIQIPSHKLVSKEIKLHKFPINLRLRLKSKLPFMIKSSLNFLKIYLQRFQNQRSWNTKFTLTINAIFQGVWKSLIKNVTSKDTSFNITMSVFMDATIVARDLLRTTTSKDIWKYADHNFRLHSVLQFRNNDFKLIKIFGDVKLKIVQKIFSRLRYLLIRLHIRIKNKKYR